MSSTIRGFVKDKDTLDPLFAAHIFLVHPDGSRTPIPTITDENGYFEAKNFDIKGDAIGVSYLGYGFQTFPGQYAGNFLMQAQDFALEGVTITAPKKEDKPKNYLGWIFLFLIVALFIATRNKSK